MSVVAETLLFYSLGIVLGLFLLYLNDRFNRPR